MSRSDRPLSNHGRVLIGVSSYRMSTPPDGNLRVAQSVLPPPRRARIEPFEERDAMGQYPLVIGIRGEEPPDRDVDPARLLARELAVSQIGFMHDLGETPKPTIPKPGPLHQRLERAIVAVVAKVHARCVEGN